MGDFFKNSQLESHSDLSQQQQNLLGPLAGFAGGQLNKTQPGYDQLLQSLLGSTSTQATDLAKQTWQKGFLDPIVNSYQQRIAPQINNQFAGIGGSLSSRRTKDLGDASSNLFAQASGQFGQMLPQIMNYPLQQTLGQIQGLGGLQQQQWTPFQNASRFATTPTQQTQQAPAGPGWGLLGSAIKAGGFAAGAIDGGSPISGWSPAYYNNIAGQGGIQQGGFVSQLRPVEY